MIKSFSYACAGVWDALKNERNFRIQWLCGLMVFVLNCLISFQNWQQTVMLMLVFFVLALELYNSALEKSCDSFGEEQSENKRRAKDFAAGSVLVFCGGSLVIFMHLIGTKALIILDFIRYNSWQTLAFFLVFFAAFPAVFLKRRGYLVPLVALSLAADGYLLITYHSSMLFILLASFFHISFVMALFQGERVS